MTLLKDINNSVDHTVQKNKKIGEVAVLHNINQRRPQKYFMFDQKLCCMQTCIIFLENDIALLVLLISYLRGGRLYG